MERNAEWTSGGCTSEVISRFIAPLKGRGARFWSRVVLAILFFGFVAYLIAGPKPWVSGVAAAEEQGLKKLDYRPYAVTGLWYAAWINAAICAVLFLAAPLLTKPFEPIKERRPPLLGWQRWVLIGSIVVSIWLSINHMVPRMKLSLWIDEERTARQLVFGNYVRANEQNRSDRFGENIVHKPITWGDTLWHYRTPNNHPFFSICARVSHNTWNAIDPPEPLHFHEEAVRFPAFLAALGALIVIPVMLVRFGMFHAAVVVPLLLAVHPWFVRFGSDARGYALTFFFAPLCLFCLWRALHSGKWRWWTGFAVFQWLLVWSHGSGLYFLVALNLFGFLAPWTMKAISNRDRLIRNGRQFLASSFSGIAFLSVFVPNLLQYAARFEKSVEPIESMGWGQIQNMLSWYFGGMSWSGLGERPFSFSLPDRFDSVPWLLWVFLALMGGLFLFGLWSFWRRGGPMRWLVIVLLVPAPLMYAVSYVQRTFLFDHYIAMAVPWVLIGIAAGAGYLAEQAAHGKPSLLGAVLPAVLVPFVLGFVSAPQRSAFVNHSMEQFREAVVLTRGSIDPEAPGYHDVLTAGFQRFTRTYDRYIYNIKSLDDVKRLVAMSDEQGKPLYIQYGQRGFSLGFAPEIIGYFENDEVFDPVTILYGLDGFGMIWIRKHTPVKPVENS